MILASFFYASTLFADSNLAFETKTLNFENNQPKYTIKTSYPQIKSPTTQAERQFNDTSKQWVLDHISQFKKSISDWDTSKLPAEMKKNGSTLTMDYDLATLDPKDLVSVRFTADTYLVGAAHPSFNYSSLNYDLVNNKVLALSDLFKSDSNYLEFIAKIATNRITKKLNNTANGKAEIFKEGLAPNPKNYSVWNLAPHGLKFTFNEYQVAAYVFGPQEIIIPFQRLSKFFSQNSVLATCIASSNCSITIQKPAQDRS